MEIKKYPIFRLSKKPISQYLCRSRAFCVLILVDFNVVLDYSNSDLLNRLDRCRNRTLAVGVDVFQLPLRQHGVRHNIGSRLSPFASLAYGKQA